MSRVGRLPVSIPDGVSCSWHAGSLRVSFGQQEQNVAIPSCLALEIQDSCIQLKLIEKSREARALWGSFRNIVAHKVQGLSVPFVEKVELVGVGYKALLNHNTLKLSLGYSHEISLSIPSNIVVKVLQPQILEVSSFCKESLGSFLGKLASFRPVEPYKGKGVILHKKGFYVHRKEGKKK